MSTHNTRRHSCSDILVVDDDTANLRYLIQILTKAGYCVRPASRGRLALRSARARVPDLILLDIKMPDMDGIEVCRQLKADLLTGAVPVVFISGREDTDMKVAAFDAGGLDYVTKPVEPREVLARVGTHLAMHELQRNLLSESEALVA